MQRRSSRQFYIAQAAALRAESVVGSSEEEPAHEKHPFSEPWEDSDLILVVENEKFHVHRQILSIHSPVFKAMLNSQFKERTAKEVPLPGKKADEMLEFLKQLYVKEKAGVTMKNVEHILKLADEYQVKGVIDLCIRCLQDEPKNEFNVVKILYLANRSVFSKEDERLEEVQDQCYNYIQDMELTDIILNEHFDDLEKQTMKNVLIRKAERLENILKRIYPQFLGLLEYCMWLCYQKKRADLQWCPIHYVAGVAKEDTCKRMTQCSVCKKMIMLMISQSFDISSETGIKKYCYGGKWHFDRNLIQVVKDLKNIVRFDPDFDL